MLKMHRAILVSSEAEAAALFRERGALFFLPLSLSLCAPKKIPRK